MAVYQQALRIHDKILWQSCWLCGPEGDGCKAPKSGFLLCMQTIELKKVLLPVSVICVIYPSLRLSLLNLNETKI